MSDEKLPTSGPNSAQDPSPSPLGKTEQNGKQRRKPEVRGQSRDYILSTGELHAMERAAKTPRQRLYVRLLARWGLRAGECAHFCLDWFSGQQGTLRIPLRCRCETCLATGKPWKPKYPNSARTLDLRKHTETLEAVKIFTERHPAISDQQVSERAVHQLVVRLADRASIPHKVFPHALRATAAVQLASGLNEMELCQVMGWNDLREASPYIRMSGANVSRALDGKEWVWW